MANDRELRIRITAEANITGLTQTRDELVELKRQAEAMGVSTGDLDKQIAKLDGQLADFGRKTVPEAGASVEGFNVHGREFRRLTGELSRIIPGLGEAMIGAFNPEVLGIVGLVIVFEAVLSIVQKLNAHTKELRENMEAIKSADLSGWLDSLHDADTAADDFNKTLGDRITLQETIKNNEQETVVNHPGAIKEQRQNPRSPRETGAGPRRQGTRKKRRQSGGTPPTRNPQRSSLPTAQPSTPRARPGPGCRTKRFSQRKHSILSPKPKQPNRRAMRRCQRLKSSENSKRPLPRQDPGGD